jgi:hypothetical protein
MDLREDFYWYSAIRFIPKQFMRTKKEMRSTKF